MTTAIDTDNPQTTNSFQLEIPTKDLMRALSLINSVVEKRNVLPILANIKLEALEGRLIITATDMDLSVSEEIGVVTQQTGALTVQSKVFGDIIRKLSDETITLQCDSTLNQLEIKSKTCQFKLPILPAQDFPTLEQDQEAEQFSIEASELSRLIEETKFSMSNEETRYTLNGIFFHPLNKNEQNHLALASTDGHRMSLSTAAKPMENASALGEGAILPKKSVLELHKIIKDPASSGLMVQISLSPTKAEFICGKMKLISKLIDGKFPNYNSFIPKENDKQLTIDTKLFAESVDRVSAVTAEQYRAVKISLNGAEIEIEAYAESTGAARESLSLSDKVQYNSEESLVIGFNPGYLLDVLSVIESEQAILEFQGQFSPVLIRNSDNNDSIFVIMPVKV